MPTPVPCVKGCYCDRDYEVSCRNAGFTTVPEGLSPNILKLDLSSNNITEITQHSFFNLTLLEELVLANNKIERIHHRAFIRNTHLKRLSLQKCSLVNVPREIFEHMKQLTALQLDQNQISTLDSTSFQYLTQLRNLRLEGNSLHFVPSDALSPLVSLEALNIGGNSISSIPVNAFLKLHNLVILLMKRNSILDIDEDAFTNLTTLRVLELDDNHLDAIPKALTKLVNLQELSVSGNKIKYIPDGILQHCKGLGLLELKGNPLAGVHPQAFAFLPKLRKLILSEARDLTEFPSLNGTTALEVLRLDRASIHSVPSSLCTTCPHLKSLDLKSNKLTTVPDVNNCSDLRVLDLAMNTIVSLDGNPFSGLGKVHDLLLSHNLISHIPKDAFYGLSKLQVLDLEANMITSLHPDAFQSVSTLEDLNLGNNIFPTLPTRGLDRLLHLKTFNNPHLREFPEPENFPRIQTLALSYAYHCCSYLPLIPAEPPPKPSLHDSIIFPTENEFDMSLWNSSLTDIWPQLQNFSKKFGTQINTLWDTFGSDFTYPGNLPAYVEEYFEEQEKSAISENVVPKTVQCVPLPGPFLPCQDLFDYWTLRCGVWVIFLLAMLGNGTVVFVLIFARSKIDVPRFLVCNLAAADFFMGLYLGLLAVVDASTLGEFRMYAIPWQMSAGCQLAGFMSVLSAELSVFTLAVITLERNYAITHAMHLNKRLSLKHAGYIMVCGWTFAIVMAVMPLLGISDYRKYATCLPFETTTGVWSLTYIVFLMFINGVAFLILMGCYLKMYCAIRGSQAWNSNDSRIAKRMALLVFTDLLCWFPIAFVSLSSICGIHLVSLEQAKVFTVFVLPLNSCCNPFLYAILTKQFKKDCVMICKTIEESRVTRGIGRCRHSSNFSNRQTPGNTNSIVDRSSREHFPHPQPCSCNLKLLGERMTKPRPHRQQRWTTKKVRRFWDCLHLQRKSHRHIRTDQYAYQIAEIQQKQHKRASSVCSSENFSSSRSDSWKQNHHHCGIPMRLLDPKRRASSWLVTRKTSQDSNLSSSRNDSSGSNNTASTSVSRISRSSNSSDRSKPRLTRQSAIVDDPDLPNSPARLTVRFLTTIPSAAETSVVNEEESYAILHPTPDVTPAASPQRKKKTFTEDKHKNP